jgi:hypothetical protein
VVYDDHHWNGPDSSFLCCECKAVSDSDGDAAAGLVMPKTDFEVLKEMFERNEIPFAGSSATGDRKFPIELCTPHQNGIGVEFRFRSDGSLGKVRHYINAPALPKPLTAERLR